MKSVKTPAGFSKTTMSIALAASTALSVMTTACSKTSTANAHRVRVEAQDGSNIRLYPNAGQLPYCLVFTSSAKGTVRQLTMSEKNLSVACPEGKAIGDLLFKIPVGEGKVKIHVVFSDREIEAIPIAQQIRELSDKGAAINGIDLRAPGTVVIDTFDFEPK